MKQMIVCIDGLIGAGKSSIMKRLKSNYPCFEEPIEKFTLLSHFYDEPQKYQKAFQFQVLLSQFDQKEKFKDIPGLIIVERCPWTSRHVFSELIFDKPTMDIYDELYKSLTYDVDYYIYLQIDSLEAYKRIKLRNKSEERNITLEYLTKLENQYKKTLLKEKNVYLVDAHRSINETVKDIRKILQSLSSSIL
ncbi:deoxyadenosine kinase-like [Stegodyphus dumicola]|uniref:deoxyadenosine kinase-like n=1 Tax=Stegodyphus dumicola TaxID=202533 RepID=UPI0015AA07A4|nr:deoxyadenosine kinase-like [Stegodyphus dumicola]